MKYSERILKGFTLIELLIVVAIIAILAAIAVPNFLEAQTRAKVSRVKNDLRTLAVGWESYRVDNNCWPCSTMAASWVTVLNMYTQFLNTLTTPISYLSSVGFPDPFMPKGRWTHDTPINSYLYMDYSAKTGMMGWGYRQEVLYSPNCAESTIDGFGMCSFGPDREMAGDSWGIVHGIWDTSTKPWPLKVSWRGVYDPTNGTVSHGDVCRWGGMVPVTSTP